MLLLLEPEVEVLVRRALHDLVERHPGVSGAVPPAPERQVLSSRCALRAIAKNRIINADLEPILERQPAESVDDEFPLPEVPGVVDAGEVARHRADGAQHLGGGDPALQDRSVRHSAGGGAHLVLPVRGLQTAGTPAARLHLYSQCSTQRGTDCTTSSLHCQFSWPAWWHRQQYLQSRGS